MTSPSTCSAGRPGNCMPPTTATSTASSFHHATGLRRGGRRPGRHGRHRHGRDHDRLTSRPGAALPDVCASPGTRLSHRRHRVQRPSLGSHRAPPVRAGVVRERPARRRPDPGSWNSQLRPAPRFRPEQDRTVSSWGPPLQADLARLYIGVIRVGSVGALVAEALARIGIEWITLLDFDTVEAVNLDRLLHASPAMPAWRAPKSRCWPGPCGAPRPLRTPGSRDWSCRSPTPPAWPPPWIATCCSAASTVPGPVPCSTWPPTPTWCPSLMAGSCSAEGRGGAAGMPGPVRGGPGHGGARRPAR